MVTTAIQHWFNMTERRERKPTWRADLTAFIEASRGSGFKWGENDCALWAASAYEAVTGFDPAHGLRGKYTTPAGALKALKKAGFETPEAIAEGRIGPQKPPAFALPGEMVAADLKALGLAGNEPSLGLSLGFCNGPICFFVSEDGLIELPTLKMACGFNG